jgi:hypothetical protein
LSIHAISRAETHQDYRVRPGTYLLDITFNVENLSDQRKVQYVLTGPVGLEGRARHRDAQGRRRFQNPDGSRETGST